MSAFLSPTERRNLEGEKNMYEAAVLNSEQEYASLVKQGRCHPDSNGWITLPSGARCTGSPVRFELDPENQLRKWRSVLEGWGCSVRKGKLSGLRYILGKMLSSMQPSSARSVLMHLCV